MVMTAALMLIGGWAMAGPARASEWVVVGQTTDKSTTLIDAASLRVSGPSVHFFSKTVYSTSTAQRRKKKMRLKATPAYTIEGNTADCRQRALGMTQWVDYGKNGQVLSSGDDAYPTLSVVIPDSIGEAMLNLVCGAPR